MQKVELRIAITAGMQLGFIPISNCLLALMVLCGCSANHAAFETKRQNAIDRVQQVYINARSPIFREWGTNLMAVVTTANPANSRTPRFASATMGRDSDGEFRLYVFWVQNAPSIDQMELRWGTTNMVETVTVSARNIEENRNLSNVSIVMVASWIWPSTDNACKIFEKIDDVSNLKVRLLQKGKAMTDWSPVSFYQLDHWMGSKEVTSVRKGPPTTGE